MDRLGLAVFAAVVDFAEARLVVSAVRDRHELAVFVLGRVPALEVEFTDRCIVQLPRDDIHHLVGDFQGLVKLLAHFQHALHFVMTLLRLTYDKLLNLLKLMHPKQAMNLLAMGPSLFSETRRVPTHFHGQLFRLKHLPPVIGGQSLLTGGNQV